MKTELICLGTELLTGKTNTNASYIGEKLSLIGLDLSYVTSVGDRLADMKEALKSALGRSRIVLLTGGLGPTFDDLTREAVADVLGRKLVTDPSIVETIRAFFARRHMEMPQNNVRQAHLVEGATVVENGVGTAPGQIIELRRGEEGWGKENALVILLPGPPREMQNMFEKTVFPFLKKYETRIKKTCTLHVIGLAESAVDELIRPVVDAERNLEKGLVDFTILAQQLIIDVRVSVSGKDEMLVDETLSALRLELRQILGAHVYGENGQTLESVVGDLLGHARRTLATAESCTGGLLARRITDIPGSSLYFTEGAVTYSNEAKMKLLGVRRESLEKHGAVSELVALEMAEGMRKAAGADYAVSITGIAGPGGGTPEKPVGLVYVGLCGPDSKQVFRLHLHGSRTDIRERAANKALDLLRRRLIEDASHK